jgi:hypothetical protein
MNERIFDLAEQAHEETYQVMGSTCLQEAFDDFYTEKFADLIVRECAGIYSKIDNGNSHMGTDDYLAALVKHFGVEK